MYTLQNGVQIRQRIKTKNQNKRTNASNLNGRKILSWPCPTGKFIYLQNLRKAYKKNTWKISTALLHKSIWFLAAVTYNTSGKGKRKSNIAIKDLRGEILQYFAIENLTTSEGKAKV